MSGPISPNELGDGAEELLERIANPNGRPVVFLFGAALTMPSPGKAGVPGVQDIVTRIHDTLGGRGEPEFDEALAAASETGIYSDAYRKGFKALFRRKGADVVNRVIREAVLEAHHPLDEAQRTRALAGHPDEHRAECKALLEHLEGWRPLRSSMVALGELLSQAPDRFGIVLTTNFDPLIEVAVRRAGGQVRVTVLDCDGNPGQHRGLGTHVVHLHGYWFDADTLHTDVQLASERPQLQRTLRRWIERSLLVVLGYGGWDDVLTMSLCEVVKDCGAYPEIAWGFYGEKDPRVVKKLEVAGERVQFYEHVDMHALLPHLFARVRGPIHAFASKLLKDSIAKERAGYTIEAKRLALRALTTCRTESTREIRPGMEFLEIRLQGRLRWLNRRTSDQQRPLQRVRVPSGEFEGPIDWYEAHEDGGAHALVHVLIVTSDGKLIIQERTDRRRDISVGGHVLYGESFNDAAAREMSEETGLALEDIAGALRELPITVGTWKEGRADHAGPPRYEDREQGRVFCGLSVESINIESSRIFMYVLSREGEMELLDGSGPRSPSELEVRRFIRRDLDQVAKDIKDSIDEGQWLEWASGMIQYFHFPENIEIIRNAIEGRVHSGANRESNPGH